MKRVTTPLLDWARLAAAFLVLAIHTGPLQSVSVTADFYLCRVLARLAVPFFFMLTGHFLAKNHWRGTVKCLKNTALLYGAAILLYLPLNLYAGGLGGSGQVLQKLLVTGSFYHLWYLPALLLGLVVARSLAKLGLGAALPLAGVLYLVGLMGDSWHGLVITAAPPLAPALELLLAAGGGYTRNGLFFAPLFLLLGAAARPIKPTLAGLGFAGALAAMSAEAFWLLGQKSPLHDSMYLLLPVCMMFLFGGLLGANRGRCLSASRLAMLVYLLHPWCIVLVRGGAKLTHTQALFIQSSPGHFAGVALTSLLLAIGLLALRPQRPDPTARAWRQVDLQALAQNARQLQRGLGPHCKLMAVVKADAYGHGAKAVAQALQKQGVRHFAVASLAEAVALRRAGVWGQILVLGYTPPAQAGLLARWGLTQTLLNEEYAQALSAQKRRIKAHLALDTGMHRLGLPAQDEAAQQRVYLLPYLKITGVFSHLCLADSLQPSAVAFTLKQAQRFYQAVEQLVLAGCKPGQVHLQASYGVLNLPPQPCALARVGIALYGVRSEPSPVQRWPDLKPALALKARVALVRELAPGEGAGYGLAFVAQRPTRLAVLAIGYGDGLPRDLAQRGGQVLIGGQRAPMVGRLCMDQTLVDVTDLPEVLAGEVATLVGRCGPEQITAEELAGHCGTIANELLARLSPRLGLVCSDAAPKHPAVC